MRASFLTIIAAVALATALGAREAGPGHSAAITTRPVAGSGVHFMTTAIVHSVEPTPTGIIQRSTETVDLTGDLVGRVLYHPTTVIDFVNGTLVNTGHQVFSGTVLGSVPVMLYDDRFRFEADLIAHTEAGKVYLSDTLAGPHTRCELDIVGTGPDTVGNGTFSYTGFCRFKTKGFNPQPEPPAHR